MIRTIFKNLQLKNQFIKIFQFNSAFFGHLIPIKLGDLGEGTKEATVKAWFVKEGSKVNEFDDLCEVFTDKLVAKIPCTHSGTVKKLYHKEQELCQVGNPIIDLELPDGVPLPKGSSSHQQENKNEIDDKKKKDEKIVKEKTIEITKETPNKVAETFPKKIEITNTTGALKFSPSVPFVAYRLGKNVSEIYPTGKNGRILKGDVINHIQEKVILRAKPLNHLSKVKRSIPKFEIHKEDKKMRIENLSRNMNITFTDGLNIPYINISEIFHMDNLTNIMKTYSESNKGKKLSYLSFFIKAVSRSLIDHPIFNTHIDPLKVDAEGYITEYIMKADHNIGFMVDTSQGLVIPNIKKCQKKSIEEINEELVPIIGRAKKNQSSLEDLSDGTFTLTNIGNLGGLNGKPLIVSPQVTIFGFGKLMKQIKFTKKGEEYDTSPELITWTTISCDHRIIDGASCVRFLMKVKNYISNPGQLLIYLK